LLAHADIRDNVIVGPGGKTGVGADDGANLEARDIVFSGNAIREHSFCSVRC